MLSQEIREIHQQSKGTYGAPRIHAELAEQGCASGTQAGGAPDASRRLAGCQPPQSATHHPEKARGTACPRSGPAQFHGQPPESNCGWRILPTSPTWAGCCIWPLCVDAWSRRVVGWAMATHLRTELVLEALHMAIQQRHPQDVIHHSDHGSQYTSLAFGSAVEKPASAHRWARSAIALTMPCARASSPPSNANCSTAHIFHTQAEARPAVFEFIEGWYNPHRRHSAIDYLSPNRYEALHARTPLSASRHVSTETG